jgi:hypothetical protein
MTKQNTKQNKHEKATKVHKKEVAKEQRADTD